MLRKPRLLLLFPLLFIFSTVQAQRDPLTWPFADTSIWNMPIGANASYVHAYLQPPTRFGMTVDEDILILTPNAPIQDIFTSYADWDRNKDRCIKEGPLLFSAPMPDSFLVSPDNWDGLTPNSGAAILMQDGRTIKQTQPFARCVNDTVTSHYTPPDVDIYGNGIRGAHGGSGLSAIGGTLRLGELDDATDTIRHVMKVNVYGANNLYYDSSTRGFRWPAIRADGYAAGNYGSTRSNPIVQACRMGALLALPLRYDLDSMAFETIPAKILARAFQTYGAYIVDDTAWDVYAIETEWSPKGRFTEEFEDAWGFSFIEANLNTPWTRDMKKIFTHLHVVDNNAPGNIGGGGKLLAPMAPPFGATSRTLLPPNTFQLFPNPTQNTLYIQTQTQGITYQVSLYNLAGQELSQASFEQEISLDLARFPRGIYLVSILNKKGEIYLKKFMKE